jgi:uncharacterized protein (TIGR02246 family)
MFSGPIEDRVAIGELNASYGHAVSSHDLDAFAALWIEDALWTHPQYGRLRGKPSVLTVVGSALGTYPLLVFMGHVGALRVDGDEARGSVYVDEVVGDQTGNASRVTGRYDDRYVRRDGRWLFAERHYNIYHLSDIDPWQPTL